MEESLQVYFDFKKNLIQSISLTAEIHKILFRASQGKDFPKTKEKIEEKILLIKDIANDFYNAFWDYKDQSKPLEEAVLHLQSSSIQDNLQKLKEPILGFKHEESNFDQYQFKTKLQEFESCLHYALDSSNSMFEIFENYFYYDHRLFQEYVKRLQSFVIFFSFEEDIQKLKTYSNDLNSISSWVETYIQIKDELPKTQVECNMLKENAKKLYIDIEKKEKLAEDTRTVIEKAIKIELSERYQERAKDYENQEYRWTLASFIEFIVLFFIGIYEINFIASSSPFQWIGFIPLNIAVIWTIIFTLSKRSEISKLRYDYAHKEVFASSYLAYQNEINELKGKHTPEVQELITQLNVKLIDSMIDTLADNPAKNLDSKKKSSELPTKEIINLVSEVTKIKNLTPIPQISIPQPQQEKEQTQ